MAWTTNVYVEPTLKSRNINSLLFIALLLGTISICGCSKKRPAAPPAPPVPEVSAPAPPTASLTAAPPTIEAGQSSTLSWQTENATEVTLDGAKVEANGSKSVSPGESTTYRLIANGAGGSREADARITVMPPPPPPPSPTDEELFAQNIKHILFDYDRYDIRDDQKSALQADAQWLAQHPTISFTVEGYCDERGSSEYNMALGDNRANAVKTALVQAGVTENRIRTVSYGKEKPFCTESNEACWQQNRRGYFVYQK